MGKEPRNKKAEENHRQLRNTYRYREPVREGKAVPTKSSHQDRDLATEYVCTFLCETVAGQ